MSELCMRICHALIRMEIALAVGGLIVLCVLRFSPLVSPRLQRALIVLVLLQGCLWFRVPLTVPHLSMTFFSIPSQSSLDQSSENDEDDSENALVAGFNEWLERSFISKTVADNPSNRFAMGAIALVSIWLLGVAVIVVSSLWNYWQFLRQLSFQSRVPTSWIDEWNELKQVLGVRQRVSFVVTDDLGPLLCWTPSGYQMVVPEGVWATFNSVQRAMICRHELAHLQRGDLWTSLVCHLVAVVHWMNPFAWWLVRHFDDAAEIACDDVVRGNAPTESCQYARTLLCLGSGDNRVLFASQANGRHGLAERIRRLTCFNPRKDSKMKKWSIAALLVGLTFVNLLQIRLHGEEAETKSKNSSVPQFGGFNPRPNSEYPAFGSVQLPRETLALASATNEKRTDAVVSVHEILKGLKEFRAKREQVNQEVTVLGQSLPKLNAELQEKVREAKANGVELDRNSIEEHHSKFQDVQTAINKKQNQFFEEAFSKITAEIELYAKENGIRVVRAKQAAKPTSNLATTLIGVTSPTLYLQSTSNSLNFVATETPNSEGEKIEIILSNNAGTLRADKINVVLTGNSQIEGASEAKPNATAKTNSVLFNDFRPLPPNSDVNFAMAQKEIIYASGGDDFDITQVIIDKMNAKFEQNASGATQK